MLKKSYNYKALSYTYQSSNYPRQLKGEALLWAIPTKKLRGSIAIEGACVCTISLLILGSFLSFFGVLREEYRLKQVMYQTQEAAIVAGMLQNDIPAVLIDNSYYLGTKYHLSKDHYHLEERTGAIAYSGESTVSLLMKKDFLTISNRLMIYGFDGYQPSKDNIEEYVYVTRYGEVYHRSLSCVCLNIRIQKVFLDDIAERRSVSGEKYYPCEVCEDPYEQGTCYITPEGNRYHSRRECSSLLRYIQKVALSKVGEKKECSYCGW